MGVPHGVTPRRGERSEPRDQGTTERMIDPVPFALTSERSAVDDQVSQDPLWARDALSRVLVIAEDCIRESFHVFSRRRQLSFEWTLVAGVRRTT